MEKALQATTQKSYYGKARVRTENDGTFLRSYNTDVCKVTNDGIFCRLWGGFSRTTLNHVNDFRRLYGLAPLNKKAWESLPVSAESESNSGARYKVEFSNGFVTWTAATIFDNEEDAEIFAENVEAARGGRVYGFVVEV